LKKKNDPDKDRIVYKTSEKGKFFLSKLSTELDVFFENIKAILITQETD